MAVGYRPLTKILVAGPDAGNNAGTRARPCVGQQPRPLGRPLISGLSPISSGAYFGVRGEHPRCHD